jgi:hypothetical protein
MGPAHKGTVANAASKNTMTNLLIITTSKPAIARVFQAPQHVFETMIHSGTIVNGVTIVKPYVSAYVSALRFRASNSNYDL